MSQDTRDAYFLEDGTYIQVIKDSTSTQVFEGELTNETSETEVEIQTSPSNTSNGINADKEGNTVPRTPERSHIFPRDHVDPGEVHNRHRSTVRMIRH